MEYPMKYIEFIPYSIKEAVPIMQYYSHIMHRHSNGIRYDSIPILPASSASKQIILQRKIIIYSS